VLLYTEMVTTGAILHGDRARLLAYDPGEHPLALQIGGSDPADLAACARIAGEAGFDEVNLNVGCPSDRVQAGRFGACLMAEPELVADGVAAMRAAVRLPVTVKCRIGIDDRDGREDLVAFVEKVAAAGCTVFAVHARKAWLQGLSPRQNREIPPLRHDVVHALKRHFPQLTIVLNGGITGLDEAAAHLGAGLDGVMIGRAAYADPYLLADADRLIYGADTMSATREAVVEAYLPFVDRWLAEGVPLHRATRHLVGLYHAVPGARLWRRYLSENAHRPGASSAVIREALALVRDAAERRAA